MDNVRYNVSPCTAAEVDEFVGKIDTSTFIHNGTVKATDKSHYDRYSYLREESRVAVVYDTSASILSITGRQDYAKQLLDLFSPTDKTIKRSTVPAQGSVPLQKRDPQKTGILKQRVGENGTRAKLFISPDSIRRRSEFTPIPTMFVSAKGAIMSTDEIYPPQVVVRKNKLPSYGEARMDGKDENGDAAQSRPYASQRDLYFRRPNNDAQSVDGAQQSGVGVFSQPLATHMERQTEQGADNGRPSGIAISTGVSRVTGGAPRKMKISFGTEDDDVADDKLKINTRGQSVAQAAQPPQEKRKRGRPPKLKAQNDIVGGAIAMETPMQPITAPPQVQEKRKRGRPPKLKAQNDIVATPVANVAPEYKNGYSIKNFPVGALNESVKQLRAAGKTVTGGDVEFGGTVQEVKSYTVTDAEGQKVLLRYATKRQTLQLQGKRSRLFGDVMSLVSSYSDYSSALENYVQESGDGKKVSDVQRQLQERLPTACRYLSEQSRIDFSYGIHDFGQASLQLSDYSVLLVTAFRGLERFIFDLQSAKNISVKMIGQAFDKDENGKYILKSGYMRRINSVIYAEVLVALYSEYFAQRNFFAHSDNTDANQSRSIPDRAVAQRIFDHLLDVVEYNAKKLKEIGFKF